MAEKASMAEFLRLGKQIKAKGAQSGDLMRFMRMGRSLGVGRFAGTTPAKAAPKAAQPKAKTAAPKPTTGTPGGVKGGRTRQPSRTTTRRPAQRARPTPARTRTRRRPTAPPRAPRARVQRQRRTTRRGVRSRGRGRR